MMIRSAVIIGCLLSALSTVQADTTYWSGDTASAFGGFTWNRPTVDDDPPTYLADVGGGQGYTAEEFTVSTSGTYSFSVQAMARGQGIGIASPATSWVFCIKIHSIPPSP